MLYKFRLICLLSVLVFSGTKSYSTEDTLAATKSLALYYGCHFLSVQNQNFSPMVHSGTSPLNLFLQYRSEKGKWVNLAELSFDLVKTRYQKSYSYYAGVPPETFATLPNTYTIFVFRYGMLQKIKETHKKDLWFGAFLDNQIHSVDNQYGRSSAFGYLAQFSLSPALQYRFCVKKSHKILLSGFAPVLSWISRNPYAVNDDQYIEIIGSHSTLKTMSGLIGDGEIQLVNHFQKLNLRVEYSYDLSARWNLTAAYLSEFFRNINPAVMIYYTHAIDVGVSFQF